MICWIANVPFTTAAHFHPASFGLLAHLVCVELIDVFTVCLEFAVKKLGKTKKTRKKKRVIRDNTTILK